MPKMTRGAGHLLSRDLRDRYSTRVPDADPLAVLDPEMPKKDAALLTRSPVHTIASHADLAPPAPRPGQDTNLGHPSRIGDRLHYRDGSVTDMQGSAVKPTPGGAKYKPLTRILK